MVDKIYSLKNKILEQVEKDMQDKGPERIDPEMVDMIKDLAEAEKSCYEADYYRAVTEAMEGGSSGYMPMGYGPYGYSRPNSQGSGSYGYRWANQYGSGTRRGYMGYQDHIEDLRQAMGSASQEDRERMKSELKQLMNM